MAGADSGPIIKANKNGAHDTKKRLRDLSQQLNLDWSRQELSLYDRRSICPGTTFIFYGTKELNTCSYSCGRGCDHYSGSIAIYMLFSKAQQVSFGMMLR